MEIITFVLAGVSLSMDALAVSISAGINNTCMTKPQALKIALYFGGFQALMPILGFLLGSAVSEYIAAFDHWIAFGLLAFIGIKMIVDVLRPNENKQKTDLLSNKVLFTMAIATSIDALAVGLGFALIGANVALGAAIIGIETFAICLVGALLGCRLGAAFEKKATIIGGIVLVAIGTKILIEHLLG